MSEPAYKLMQTTVCAECRKQHVLADGIPVCGHVSTDSGNRICRRCWGKLDVRKKHKGQKTETHVRPVNA